MVAGNGCEVPGASPLALWASALPWAADIALSAGAASGCARDKPGALLTGCGTAVPVALCPGIGALGAAVLGPVLAATPSKLLRRGIAGCGGAGAPLGSPPLSSPFSLGGGFASAALL